MDFDRAETIVCALVIAILAGCGGEGKDVARTSVVNDESTGGDASAPAAASSDLRWRNDTYRELDGDDENAERLVVSVSKDALDSTMVRLEIRTSKDRLLYRHEWPAVSYMKYDAPGSARDSMAVLRETERELARIFSDSAFIRGTGAAGADGVAASDLDAIRYDIAEHQYRTVKSLKRWDPLPAGAHDEINTIAGAVPLARIQAIAAETRDMPAFRYYAGGEETYVVAWSASEGRMVRIAACC